MTASFKNKITILFLFIVVVMLTGGLFITYKTKKAFLTSAFWTEHTHHVIFETQNILSLIQDIQLGGRGYVITGDSTFLEPVNRSTSLALTAIQKLKTITLDNAHQTPRIDSVALLMHSLINYVSRYTLIRKEKGFPEASKILSDGKGNRYLESIRNLLDTIQKAEYKLLQLRKEANQKSVVALNRILIFLFCSQILFITIIFFVVRYNIKVREKNDKSEIRFRNTLDEMLEGVEIIGFDYRYLYVNHAYENQVKHTRDELLGHTVMEKFPDIENTAIFNAIQQCFQERVAIHLEDSFTFSDKTKTWFEISFQPVPEGVFILSIDITEKKQAAEKVRQSEERFRSLIENSHDIVSIVDKSFKPIYRSPSSARITGYEDDERDMIGGGTQQTHPNDVEMVIKTMNEVLANPNVPIPLRFRVKHKDGHYVLIDGIVTNMIHDESIQGIVANFRDITENQKAEEKIRESEKIYKTIASSIPGSVICLFDKDYRYLLIEGDMLESMGYVKEKLLGNKMTDVIPPNRLEEVAPHFRRVFEGESFSVENFREGFDVLSRFVPLRDEDNQVFAAMVVVFDVSELKKAQRAIADLNVGLESKIKERTLELETVNKALEAFSYSVAHDLRTPLRAVYGYATMLEEGYSNQLDKEGKRLIDSIGRNAKKMGTLIDDLLTFSRLGRTAIKKSLTNMMELAESSLRDMNLDDAYPGNIKINNLHSTLADCSLMKHVIINLLSNAIKYSSKKEKPVIEISSRQQNKEIIYSITDNGVGFDMKYANKLFGVFQRLHSEEEFTGTGVGLAIVERIIHKHDGKVWAESEINKGATFYFTLPVIPGVQ